MRATFIILERALAERCSVSNALRSTLSHSVERRQYFLICLSPILALVRMPSDEKRSRWTARAASTLSLTFALGSSVPSAMWSSYFTESTST